MLRFISALCGLPFLLYGVLCICLGLGMYLLGVAMVIPRALGLNQALHPLNEVIVWYSGAPVTAGLVLGAIDLFVLFPSKRSRLGIRYEAPSLSKITVALTAYNDEQSIGASVADFLAHPRVDRVIVVSNCSTDRTVERAEAAGAVTVLERRQGYGQCVHRCFSEAVRQSQGELIVLCEGDQTFRADDLDKFLAYAPHADIVNGTRTIERLRQYDTQLSTFMFFGNLFVGKLLEAKHLGKATITDVGTTYKMCRRDALVALLPHLNPSINLEFNIHFLDVALRQGLTVVECPVTFHQRVGISKGGNLNNSRALKVGVRMILGVVFGWQVAKDAG